jgi:predicted glycosyl hydrolase (DUF1957 family)
MIGTALLGLQASNTLAQTTVPMDAYCDQSKVLLTSLLKDYREHPVITGKMSAVKDGVMSVWINPENNSWTVVVTKDTVSCILSSGTELKVRNSVPGTRL